MVGLFTLGIIRHNHQAIGKLQTQIPISVVVAMRNEEENIDNLLLSLASQVYPKNLVEIVLVNDHSTDSTVQKAMEWSNRTSNLKVFELPNDLVGKKQAVALGVGRAKHNHIVLTDADCTHPTIWLELIASQFEQSKLNLIIGPVMLLPAKTFFQKLQALEHASLQASTIGACGVGFPIMASSANLAFDREGLGFSSQMLNLSQPSGDDVFLLHSAKRMAGSKKVGCIHHQNALAFTKPSDSLKQFLTQRGRWASKAGAYRDFGAITVALVVLLFNVSLLGLIVSLFFAPHLWPLLAIGYGVKILADFPLLWLFLKKYGKTSLLMVFLPLQLVYPLYVLVASFISIFGTLSWKERMNSNI